MIASAIALVSRLSRRASTAAPSPRLETSAPGPVWTKIATTGSVRKASASASARVVRSVNGFSGSRP
jgi:hypothetical protein